MKKSSKKKKIIISVVVIVIIILLICFIAIPMNMASKLLKAAVNEVVSVQSDDMIVSVSADGSVEGGNPYNITAPVSAKIAQVYAKIGQSIKEGEKIAEYDQQSLEDRLLIARQELTDIDAALKNLDGEKQSRYVKTPADGEVVKVYAKKGDSVLAIMEQYGMLAQIDVNGKLISITASSGEINEVYAKEGEEFSANETVFYLSSDVDVSDSYTQKLNERINKSEEIAQTEELLKTLAITANEDIIIQEVLIAENVIVDKDAPIVSAIASNDLSIWINVDELDIAKIALGQKANIILDALPGETFESEVTEISAIGTQNSGITTFGVKLSVPVNLKIGMNVSADIIINELKEVLTLPIKAINTANGEDFVWLETADTAPSDNPGVKQTVTTGLSDNTNVQITQGLNEGDRIVVVRSASGDNMMSMFGGMPNPQAFGMERPSGAAKPAVQ